MLSWINRDGRIILASRIARGIGYGFFSVDLAIYLSLLGFGEIRVGIILAAALLSAATFTILAGILERKIGRKSVLAIFAVMMSAAGLLFTLSTNYFVLLLAASFGTANVTGSELGPFLSVEQAIIPQTCSQQRRTSAFATYSLCGTLASSAGALLSGFPSVLQSYGLSLQDAFKPVFGLYAFAGGVTLVLYMFLSAGVEAPSSPSKFAENKLMSLGTRRIVARLSGLFAVDSFGGGFVLQSIVSYWFFVRYGASLWQISLIFSASGLLAALSFPIAAGISRRIGLVNTMVFTHLPSNVLLMLVPLAPNLGGAIAFYLARMSLSQMDVPTRQSYIAAIVGPKERTLAAGVTNISRNLAQASSPTLSEYALRFISLSSPFLIGGGVKTVYDLLLYASFRKLKSPEEIER